MNPARRETVLNFIGLGLLALCFVLSLGRIAARYFRPEETGGKTSIRFAHWQLEGGIREAYDRIAADYMKLHPDVTVEQTPVPEQVYANWLRTQLVGGTAPEIIELDSARGGTSEVLSTYFQPVTPYLQAPNPYNRDNDLSRVSWKDTFIDGMSHAYNQELLEYYNVPGSMFTIRMFYNRPLWREVFGGETVPRTYEEMVADCRRAEAYRTASGQPIVALAGASSNAPFMIQRLFSSQTQRLFFSLARPGELYPSNEELALDFLAGRWSFDKTPAAQDGLELVRGVGQFLPAGFLQLKREDALFLFSQGRALMTVTGSWDSPSIHAEAPFEVGVFDVPLPAADDPHYGHNTVGVVSEAGAATGLPFGVTKQKSAAKLAQVIDFLRFLTCRESNRKFSELSGWLPAVVGVVPPAAVQPFLPRLDGYPAGFMMGVAQGDSGGGFGAETSRIVDTNMYRLFEVDGSPAAYAQAIAGPLRPAVVTDFSTIHRNQLDALTRQDTTQAAYRALGGGAGGKEEADGWAAKVNELDELQTQEEIAVAARRWKLGQIGVTMEK